jgi:hypothetical protein
MRDPFLAPIQGALRAETAQRAVSTRNSVKGVLAKSKSMKKTVMVDQAKFVNSLIIGHLHIAAVHRTALRDLGNTPLSCAPKKKVAKK